MLDYVHHESLELDHLGAKATTFRRMVIDIPRRTARSTEFAGFDVEFPRINDAFEATSNRYAYMPTSALTPSPSNPSPGAQNALLKFDTERGVQYRHDFGDKMIGEAAFIPSPGGSREDDGYLAVFCYDTQGRHSDFVLLNAARIEEAPVAVVRLPQRVPQGLHGNWITGD